MKFFARILLLTVALLLLSHYLPAGYWLLAAKKNHSPTVFYSCVEKRFLFYRFGGQGQALQYVDAEGKNYTRDEFETLLPMDNYLQLLRDGKLPKSINDTPISPEAIRRARVTYKIKPILLDSPIIPLTPLLEADNGRVKLEVPEDFMRLGKSIEFINAATNIVDREKSDRFAKALASAGFVFPATQVYGNPTTMKAHDEGYFVVDSKNTTFQLRQVRGEPEIRRIADVAQDKAAWESIKPRFILVQEQESREIRSLLVDQSNHVYFVTGTDYRLVPVPLTRYNPSTMNLVVRGDLLNYLVTVSGENQFESIVLDRKYQLVDRYSEPLPRRDDTLAGRIAKTIFPFIVDFDNESAGFFGFFPEFGNRSALALNFVLALGVVGILTVRKQLEKERTLDLLFVAVGGIYGLILMGVLPKTK